MYDVVTVGSATVDAFAETDKKFLKKGKFQFKVGTKLLVKSLIFDVGGGGTNSAVALSRLGLKTAFLGKLGRGENSKRILNLLKEEKIDTALVCRESARTGFSIVLDAKGHDRTILTYKGSNEDLNVNDIRFEYLDTSWLYMSSMTGKSFDSVKRIVEFAQEKGIRIAFNPSSYMTEKGANYLKPIISKTELLIMNLEEATMLSKKKDIKKTLKFLHEMGPRLVVVTNGKKDVFVYNGEMMYNLKPHAKIKIVETTGAGDAFASSFLAGIIKTEDIEFSLQLALVNAESVITHHGAKNKLLKMGEAIRNIKKNPGKIIMRKLK